MKKSWSAAVAAAVLITGGGALHAMDYRIGFQARTDGGWSPFQFRYHDYSDDKAATAHVRESDGEPVALRSNGVGDMQVLDPNGYGYTGAYENGFAIWSGGKAGYRFQPSFGARSNNGAFSFGGTFMIKCKENDAFEGNGYNAYISYKNFELKAATTGSLGYGAYVGTGGTFVGSTSALFLWEVTEGEYKRFSKNTGTGIVSYTGEKGDQGSYNSLGYQVSNAGLGVESGSDKSSAVGLQWTQKVRGTDTLNLRIANMHSFGQDGIYYSSGREYDAKYPIGWNFQANYRMPAWTFSTTFKIKGASDVNKYEKPDAFNIAGHVGIATTRIAGISLSAGYGYMAEQLGESAEGTVDGVNYSKKLWGHNFGLAASWRIRDWSFNAGNTTSLFLLSDYQKAVSSYNRYGWRPYLGTSFYLNATKRLNGLMVGHLNFGFEDGNLNSYTDGKAEASFSFTPSVDIAPTRGVNVNIALSMSFQNLSDQARGWFSDYGSDSDFGSNAGEIYYTYPHTFYVSIPISVSFSI